MQPCSVLTILCGVYLFGLLNYVRSFDVCSLSSTRNDASSQATVTCAPTALFHPNPLSLTCDPPLPTFCSRAPPLLLPPSCPARAVPGCSARPKSVSSNNHGKTVAGVHVSGGHGCGCDVGVVNVLTSPTVEGPRNAASGIKVSASKPDCTEDQEDDHAVCTNSFGDHPEILTQPQSANVITSLPAAQPIAGPSTHSLSSRPTSSFEPPNRARSATKTPRPYLVTPKQEVQRQDVEAFTRKLKSMFEEKRVHEIVFENYTTNSNETRMWSVALLDEEAQALSSDPVVLSVDPDIMGTFCSYENVNDRNTSHMESKRAQVSTGQHTFELAMLSTPPSTPLSDQYVFDDSAGARMTVYILDSGFMLEHPEFESTGRWARRVPIADQHGMPSEREQNRHHATCVASKAVGRTVGAAPEANFVFVDVETSHFITVCDGLRMISRDVRRRDLKARAVVVMSVHYPIEDLSLVQIDLLEAEIQHLLDNDVVVVVPSGNKGHDVPIDSYPALFSPRLPVIVVGAVDGDGQRTSFSQTGPSLVTHAGGSGVTCANSEYTGDDTTLLRIGDGTSYAAGIIGGMIAYWLGHPHFGYTFRMPEMVGRVAQNVRSMILQFSYVRSHGGPPVAWNRDLWYYHPGDADPPPQKRND